MTDGTTATPVLPEQMLPDACVAVQEVLSPGETRKALQSNTGTRMSGCRVADLIDHLQDHDWHLDIVEPWHEQVGGRTIGGLMKTMPQLPEPYVRQLVSAALMVLIVSFPEPTAPVGVAVYRLARQAGCYAAGYATALLVE